MTKLSMKHCVSCYVVDLKQKAPKRDNGSLQVMVILRATKKLLSRLPTTTVDGESDTALGDWYANRSVMDRKPLLILISSESLLPILTPARDLEKLPANLPRLVEERLIRLGTPTHVIDQEIRAMSSVRAGPTRDRSVVGMLNSFARDLSYILGAVDWDETDLPAAEMNLANTPCRVTSKLADVIYPDKVAPTLLMQKWGTNQ